MTSIIVLIPALNPDSALVELVGNLQQDGSVIIIVDDGSSNNALHIFDKLEILPTTIILRHEINKGKGAALKTGLKYVKTNFPNHKGVVTADADGQHTATDIAKIGRHLDADPSVIYLGIRRCRGTAPLRSRFGNTLTKYLFNKVTGLQIQDTQSGLRGFPIAFIDPYLFLKHDHYEYELEVLIKSKSLGHSICQVEIESVYINKNASSHFKPIIDSFRIYSVLFRTR